MAVEPSWGAVTAESEPRKDPIGVRAAERMTTSLSESTTVFLRKRILPALC
jgi:hypothetical protein